MPETTHAILFDFDLTLADSSDGIVACAQYALERLRLPIAPAETIRESIGLPLTKTFTFLSGIDDAVLAAAFSKHFVAHADEVMVASTRIYEPAPDLLKTLRDNDVRIGVVSTKFRYRIEAILAQAGLQTCVDTIVGGEDVTQHKPDPEGLLLAIDKLGVRADHAVYVGDHAVDAEAADRAGMRFIGAVSGTTDRDAWQARGRQSVDRDIGDIASLLRLG